MAPGGSEAGDLLQPGYSSNYTERRSPWIYFSETCNAATWERIWQRAKVQPNLPGGTDRSFMDDPNLTDKKYPGNPHEVLSLQEPLRVLGEHLDCRDTPLRKSRQ